ncbi:MAG: murein biosynthesis integral membrane protein MurJ [Myxococcota bacterium]
MSIGRTSVLLVPLAVGARTVAFFVPIAIAHWYGVQRATDAFWWALSVPTFLLVLGATTMGTVVVPPLAELRERRPDRVGPFLGGALAGAFAIATGIGVLFAAVAPVALPRLTAFDAETRDLAAAYCWALLPFLASVGVNAVLKSANEVHGRFAGPAAGPFVRAGVALGTLALARDTGPMALPLGVGAGNLAETAWLWWNLRAAGVRVTRSRGVPPELVAAAVAFGPVLGGETMVALNILVDKLFAGFLDPGSVSLLEYADRARMIPQTILESTLSVVAFNAWAAARARGDESARKAAVATSLWWIVLLAPPVLAGMWIGRVALIRMLYEGGVFEPRWTGTTAAVLGAFVPGVFFSLLGALVVRAHIVDGRTGLVLRLGIVSFVLNASLNALLMPRFGLLGLAASTTITGAIVTSVSFAMLVPRIRGAVPARALRDAAIFAGMAVALAIGAATAGFAPASVGEAGLWMAALPCVALLGAGAWRARTGP